MPHGTKYEVFSAEQIFLADMTEAARLSCLNLHRAQAAIRAAQAEKEDQEFDQALGQFRVSPTRFEFPGPDALKALDKTNATKAAAWRYIQANWDRDGAAARALTRPSMERAVALTKAERAEALRNLAAITRTVKGADPLAKRLHAEGIQKAEAAVALSERRATCALEALATLTKQAAPVSPGGFADGDWQARMLADVPLMRATIRKGSPRHLEAFDAALNHSRSGKDRWVIPAFEKTGGLARISLLSIMIWWEPCTRARKVGRHAG